jgi:hypothetical protein
MSNLIIITSVINTHPSPLSYGQRSVYSPQERYEQTLKTIESCNKIPSGYKMLIETSDLDKKMEDDLKSKVDFYVNFNQDKNIKDIIDSPHKGRSEATQIINAINLIDYGLYENIYKVSGRYWLSDNFNYDNYDNEKNVFRVDAYNNLTTALYKINKNSYPTYINCLEYCCSNIGQIESQFWLFFKDNFISYDKIGLNGNVSVNGQFIDF